MPTSRARPRVRCSASIAAGGVGAADGRLEPLVLPDGDPHPRQHGQEREGADAEQRVPQAEVSEQPQHGRPRLYSAGTRETSVSPPPVAASATLAHEGPFPCARPSWPSATRSSSSTSRGAATPNRRFASPGRWSTWTKHRLAGVEFRRPRPGDDGGGPPGPWRGAGGGTGAARRDHHRRRRRHPRLSPDPRRRVRRRRRGGGGGGGGDAGGGVDGLRPGASPGSPRRAGPDDGLLLPEQRRHRRRGGPGDGRRAGAGPRLGRAPRQRDAGGLLGAARRPLPVGAPVPLLSGDRRHPRDGRRAPVRATR